MSIKRMPISLFVSELEAALNRKDGYIMGAKGQDPKKLNDWFFNQYADRDNYTAKQEAKALYWKKNARRVWDCNGLAEGIYQDYTGVNINTKARYNYAEWCKPKGKGMIPAAYRVPGAAVFTGSKASSIPHVMYLYKPVVAGKPDGDWYLIEARGVMYGVVKTKLSERKPTFWGHMTKYFDYGNTSFISPSVGSYKLGERILLRTSPLMEGEDVRALQTRLNALGFNCGEVDGEFGKNTEKGVKAFQKAVKMTVDGAFGAEELKALEAYKVAEYEEYPVQPKDSLWKIAKRFLGSGVKYTEIVKLNGLKSTVIYTGQVLKIPKK